MNNKIKRLWKLFENSKVYGGGKGGDQKQRKKHPSAGEGGLSCGWGKTKKTGVGYRQLKGRNPKKTFHGVTHLWLPKRTIMQG